MSNDLSIELVDFIDLIDETLSKRFIEKWRFRFSEKFIQQFQSKIFLSLKKSKPLKIQSLYNHFTKKCKYSSEQVINFFEAIDIRIYYPLIQGKLELPIINQ